jgi:hypothetical protein
MTSEKNYGLYLGTEINEQWWKRYTKDKLFMRGNGNYWYNDKGFCFLRYLTKTPIFIPFHSFSKIKLGTWHSGRWAFGNLIIKLIWKKEDLILSSGFIVSVNREETESIKQLPEYKIASH